MSTGINIPVGTYVKVVCRGKRLFLVKYVGDEYVVLKEDKGKELAIRKDLVRL